MINLLLIRTKVVLVLNGRTRSFLIADLRPQRIPDLSSQRLVVT